MPKNESKLTSTAKLIANALLAKRKSLKLSQVELARSIGSTTYSSWIGAVERGQKIISISKLDALLKAMSTDLTNLLLDHAKLTENQTGELLNKDHLKCWNLIKEFDQGQIKVLNEVLKIISKHKNEIKFPHEDNPHKLKLARNKNKNKNESFGD